MSTSPPCPPSSLLEVSASPRPRLSVSDEFASLTLAPMAVPATQPVVLFLFVVDVPGNENGCEAACFEMGILLRIFVQYRPLDKEPEDRLSLSFFYASGKHYT